MKLRRALTLTTLGLFALGGAGLVAQRFESREQGREALDEALDRLRQASSRSERLQAESEASQKTADKAGREAAALAAKIQEAEAGIGAAEERIALVERQRARLDRDLASHRQPLVHLTASLQNFSRRPLALAVFQPGSVKDMVYLRAMLGTAVPRVKERTSGLRAQIEEGRALKIEAEKAAISLREQEKELRSRRNALAALEARERITSRRKGGEAAREADRALVLAEEARDLDSLVGQFDRAASLRQQLASLPGPILRPVKPEEAQIVVETVIDKPGLAAPRNYRLPVAGRTISGFGVPTGDGTRASGIKLAPIKGAQVVSPASGRVAFAGPYRGYGQIVIVEHEGGWTSLVTGLANVSVEVGDKLLAGSPLGMAADENPEVGVELRRDGTPVNPLEFIG